MSDKSTDRSELINAIKVIVGAFLGSTNWKEIEKQLPANLIALGNRRDYIESEDTTYAEEELSAQDSVCDIASDEPESYLNITFKKHLNPHQVVFSVDTNVDLETSPYASYYELCDSQLYLNGRLTSPFRNVKAPFERILRSLGEYFEKRLNHLSFSHGSFVMLMKPPNDVQSVAIHEIIVDIVKYELYGKTDEPTDLHVRVEK